LFISRFEALSTKFVAAIADEKKSWQFLFGSSLEFLPSEFSQSEFSPALPSGIGKKMMAIIIWL